MFCNVILISYIDYSKFINNFINFELSKQSFIIEFSVIIKSYLLNLAVCLNVYYTLKFYYNSMSFVFLFHCLNELELEVIISKNDILF